MGVEIAKLLMELDEMKRRIQVKCVYVYVLMWVWMCGCREPESY